jgi:hypothetical protein
MEVADPDDGVSKLDVNSLLHTVPTRSIETPLNEDDMYSRGTIDHCNLSPISCGTSSESILRGTKNTLHGLSVTISYFTMVTILTNAVTKAARPVRDSEGRPVCETEFSDNLLMFLLKAYDRKRFGDKIDTTFGPNWSGILEDLPEELLKQIAERLEAQAAAAEAKQLEQGQTIDLKPEPPVPGGQS